MTRALSPNWVTMGFECSIGKTLHHSTSNSPTLNVSGKAEICLHPLPAWRAQPVGGLSVAFEAIHGQARLQIAIL